MEDFAKSILNYFATYTETRFRFNKRISYSWSDDEFTLDFSVFPNFKSEIMRDLERKGFVDLDVKKGMYTIELSEDVFKKELINELEGSFNEEYLNKCIEDIREKLTNKLNLVVSEDGSIEKSDKIDSELKKKIKREGFRKFNLAFRKKVKEVLYKIQNEKKESIKKELNCEHLPASSFNSSSVEQDVFDSLSEVADSTNKTEEYIGNVVTKIKESEFDLVMYDLYLMLNSFTEFINTKSVFLFFHEISGEKNSYPIYFLEINLKKVDNEIKLKNVRNILMVNTPAINYFKFKNVLTTPRACQLENFNKHIKEIDHFLQAYYKNDEDILLQPDFKKIVAEDLPEIKPRIGLRLLEDDRKILDYSELITDINKGAGNKFVDLVSDYVDSNVENTSEEVHEKYKERYSKKSVKNITPSVPLSLNDSQKRVLLATENEKNKVIKVEGPPGTGKSYTITALIYLANQLDKSVLITSHKSEALDVVEKKITKEFKKLHPKAKPSVLRLSKNPEETINSLGNTLSATTINSASERSLNFNKEAVKKDSEKVLASLEKQLEEFWENAENYNDYIKLSGKLTTLERDLFGEVLDLRKIPDAVNTHKLKENKNLFSEFKTLNDFSWRDFYSLYQEREKLDGFIDSCNRINKSNPVFKYEQIKDLDLGNLKELLSLLDSFSDCFDFHTKLKNFEFKNLKNVEIDNQFVNNFQNLKNLKSLLNDYKNLSSGIKNKIFKRKEKEKAQKKIKDKFPDVHEELQNKDLESLIKKTNDIIKRVESVCDNFPFLKKDYLLKSSQNNFKEIKDNFKRIDDLQFSVALEWIADKKNKENKNLTLGEIKGTTQDVISSIKHHEHKERLSKVSDLLGVDFDNLGKLYKSLQATKKILSNFSNSDVERIDSLFEHYEKSLEKLNIRKDNIKTLARLAKDKDKIDKFWRFVELHKKVSEYSFPDPPDFEKVKKYQNKIQEILEHQNDNRLKNLNNYQGDVQRIVTAINSGKRINSEEAKILFDNLSCIIAPPNLVSEYFPMDKNMVDMLIIDEASQVSIADSMSLILRADQTIVFGDQLQYGAVDAVRVNKKYSKRFFKDILENYEKDKNEQIDNKTKDRLAEEVSEEPDEENRKASTAYMVDPNKKEWLKTFGIRTSTLSFAEAIANYKTSLNVHFRSFPEIISYSDQFFYNQNQINLIKNRIRTKPISKVLRFLKVDSQGLANKNVNLDEIEAIKNDIERLTEGEYKNSIGIICSFTDQAERMREIFSQELNNYHKLKRENDLRIWSLEKVQGIERDIIYYSFVEDKDIGNGSLRHVYPVVGGVADDIRNLKKQKLNVEFSRAKDTMVFVHSMPLNKYSDTCLGAALKHYEEVLKETPEDDYIEDPSVFDSPAEENLYKLITQTDFYRENKKDIRFIPQFNIGKYIKDKYHKHIPDYRVDFLMTLTEAGKEKSLIIEYDGVEYHFKNPEEVDKHNFDQEYLEYDIQRQLELEQYGYSFLRVNKFNLMPKKEDQTKIDVLNQKLIKAFK